MPTGVYVKKKIDPLQRFQKFVVISESGCWLWAGSRDGDGYGHFWNGSGYTSAHVWAYEHHKGEIPVGLVVDHTCFNPSCVNPAHLEAVTMKVNTERGLLYQVLTAKAIQKTLCKRGHSLSGDNLFRDKRGDRCCKTCRRNKSKEWRIMNQERVNELQRIRRAK